VTIEIIIKASRETLRASISGTELSIAEPNEVAVRSTQGGRQMLVAVGRMGRDRRESTDGLSFLPAYDPEAFDPYLTASVLNYLQMALYSRYQRPFLRGMFDRLRIAVTLADYDRIPADQRALFERELGEHTARGRNVWLINTSSLQGQPRRWAGASSSQRED